MSHVERFLKPIARKCPGVAAKVRQMIAASEAQRIRTDALRQTELMERVLHGLPLSFAERVELDTIGDLARSRAGAS